MTEKVQKSVPPKRLPHQRKIAVCTCIAWLFVIAGVVAFIPAIARMFHDATGKPVKISVDNLSLLGNYLQGAVQSLWSLAAFLFIYVAFLGQQQQLQQQTEQFEIEQERQRQERLSQDKEFQVQQKAVQRQNFETAFFQMLGVQNQLVVRLRDADPPQQPYDQNGPCDCFQRWYEDFKRPQSTWGDEFKMDEKSGIPIEMRAAKDDIERYMGFYRHYQGVLGHYFRNLYHIIKFVNETAALADTDKKQDYKNRRFYTSLVRATLSQYELALLFYNCLSSNGDEFFKPLVEKYGLLKNFAFDSTIDERDKAKYNDSAFE